MAADTRNKRMSMVYLRCNRRIMPNPDGTLANASDRERLLGLYGNLVPEGVVSVSVPSSHRWRNLPTLRIKVLGH